MAPAQQAHEIHAPSATGRRPAGVATIHPADAAAMEAVSDLFGVGQIHKGGNRATDFVGIAVADVDRLLVVAFDHPADDVRGGRLREHAWRTVVILELAVPGILPGPTLFEATWAAYVLSLQATVDAGTNRRAHVGDGSCVADARAMVARMGAKTTPHRCVYGSEGNYLDAITHAYDPGSRTLSVRPSVGS